MYTKEEKVNLILWYNLGMSLREVSAMFSATYPNRPIPSPTTISRCLLKFKNEGCVQSNHSNRTQPPRVMSEEKKLEVILHAEDDKRMSTKSIALAVGCSKTSVHRVLKNAKYRSYKFQNHQELLDGDKEARMDFCFRVFEMINTYPRLLHQVLFTDEATFTVNGEVNRQNCRYWSRNNMHLFNATRTQRPQKVNVWAGLIGRHIIGPFFIDGNLTGDKYLELLRNRIVPALRALNINGQVWYQHDGAPPHYMRRVRDFLEETFPGSWIGRGGEIKWPARSPDLAPNDYFYWGYLKSKVYDGTTIMNVNELKDRITRASNEISGDQLSNVMGNFFDRLTYCMQVNGGIFENQL